MGEQGGRRGAGGARLSCHPLVKVGRGRELGERRRGIEATSVQPASLAMYVSFGTLQTPANTFLVKVGTDIERESSEATSKPCDAILTNPASLRASI